MPDLENQEFRESAEQMWARDSGLKPGHKLSPSNFRTIDLLARAMRIAAEETTDYCIQVAGPEDYKAVASRISSRIKGKKVKNEMSLVFGRRG